MYIHIYVVLNIENFRDISFKYFLKIDFLITYFIKYNCFILSLVATSLQDYC